MQPTAEQAAIVDHVPSARERILIKAYAGSGKTSTCRQIVERHGLQEYFDGSVQRRHAQGAGHRFLYLAFNKAIQVEAEGKFNGLDLCDCRTAHSLALEYVTSVLPNAKVGELRVSQGCRSVLRDWFLSDRAELPPASLVRFGPNYVAEAHDVWQRMISGSMPFSHDAYVKYFCTDPRSVQWLCDRYDTIILDEAQDTSVVLLDWLLKLPQCIYLVGDQHQAIYGFRNATNALQRVQSSHSFALTESFRFGPEIANLCNRLLVKFNLDKGLLRGSSKRETQIIGGEPDMSKTWAVIGRSNAKVFQHAVELASEGRTLSFVCRDPNAVPVIEAISQALNKYSTRGRLSKDLERDLENAKANDDKETMRTLKLLKTKGPLVITQWLRQVRSATRAPQHANCLLGTVHGHKGLEWSNVYLINDFANLPQLFEALSRFDCKSEATRARLIEEVHLIYVAITRAKDTLLLNGKIGQQLAEL